MRNQFLFVLMVGLIFQGCGSSSMPEETSMVTDSVGVVSPLDSINVLIRQSPNKANLYYQRAGLHVASKDYASSVADLNRAFALDSLNADFYVLKGKLELLKGNGQSANTYLNRALELEPENMEAHLKLSKMFQILKQYDKSMSHLNEVLKIDLHNAEAYYEKGLNYKYLGDTAKAVSSFQTAIEQNPALYDGFVQLGLIYATVGDPLAEAYYNNAIKLRPSSTEAIYNKCMFLQENGNPEKAIEGYQIILNIEPKNPIPHYNIGYVNMIYVQDLDEAINSFTTAIAMDDQYYQAYYNRGYCNELKQENTKAANDFKKSLSINPQFDLAAKGLTRVEG